jgi:hypothetical protein
VRCVLILLLFCSSAVVTSAQTTKLFSVNVEVSGDYASEAESYLKRELRSLGDVVVTSKNPDYTIDLIIASVTAPIDGVSKEVGLSFSWVTLSHTPPVGMTDHLLAGDGKDSLKKRCEKYIARFDVKNLEPRRRK